MKYEKEGLLGYALDISVEEARRLKGILDSSLNKCQDDDKFRIIIPHEIWKD